jgi:hypothetical protein
MKKLPLSNSDHRNEFLAQCDQEGLAKARAGDENWKATLQQQFEEYKKAVESNIELEQSLIAAENLAEFRSNPTAAIRQVETFCRTFSPGENALIFGLFTIVSENWTRAAGIQFPKGSDWGGQVAQKGWKATIDIGGTRHTITGQSYYGDLQRHESVCNEAWKVLLRSVGIDS